MVTQGTGGEGNTGGTSG